MSALDRAIACTPVAVTSQSWPWSVSIGGIASGGMSATSARSAGCEHRHGMCSGDLHRLCDTAHLLGKCQYKLTWGCQQYNEYTLCMFETTWTNLDTGRALYVMHGRISEAP